jgi:small subunit ribosomal protein S3Ae
VAVQKADKWKLKKWFTVYAPKLFNEAQICEMPANEDSTVIGRNIRVGLNTLTKNPAHAYTNVTLRITGVNGEAAQTRLVMIEQLYSYIHSLVRRYRGIASSVSSITTKDNVGMVAKMLVVTQARVAHTKIKGIREETGKFIADYFSSNDADSVVSSIIEGKLQGELAAKLRHITPINKVEVKKLEIAQASPA